MGWTPRIVAGTDYAPDKPPVVSADHQVSMGLILNGDHQTDANTIIEMTQERLSEHASMVSIDLKPTWTYGPITKVRDGITMIRGQYVTEYHLGIHVYTYWIQC